MSFPSSLDFATIMSEKYPEYQWKAMNVSADDENGTGEYLLTTFKLWNPTKRDESKGWVFF